jgi:hypothetical protein
MCHPNIGITAPAHGHLGDRTAKQPVGIVGDLAVWRNYGLKLEAAVGALVFSGLIPAASRRIRCTRVLGARDCFTRSSSRFRRWRAVPRRSLSSETARYGCVVGLHGVIGVRPAACRWARNPGDGDRPPLIAVQRVIWREGHRPLRRLSPQAAPRSDARRRLAAGS